jgi:hypothetical protein
LYLESKEYNIVIDNPKSVDVILVQQNPGPQKNAGSMQTGKFRKY